VSSLIKHLPSFLMFITMAPSCAGWGSFGHQKVNFGAVQLMKDTPWKDCFEQNSDFLQRLSISPDYEWKMIGERARAKKLREQIAELEKSVQPIPSRHRHTPSEDPSVHARVP